ncbi:alpha/beta fold hydrolase [Marinifilum sp. N1E240]|uniref:alpha/beta fold hydrolase n=1 Tax=Marinifilum sp. N1E240 TaxID=2608082 RepID=UPI00128B993A|nr:alpha/beta hydrolase [Marinifilum sp. N1E240]MPQ45386.1 alpha/beta fold hydrolase [Marinifilum sp. N1E240]
MSKIDQYLELDNYSLRFRDKGKGNTVLLLHGYLESIETFETFANDLSRLARVITVDLPGHGLSELKTEKCSVDDMADAVDALASHLKLEKINIAGHSMGGYVALAYADKYVEKLESFCLFHSSPNPDTEEKKANRKKEIALVRKGKKELICKTSIPNTFSNRNLDKFAHEIDRITEIACKTSDKGIIAALEAMMDRPDRNHVVKALDMPKVSIIGKMDNFIPFQVAGQIAKENNLTPFVLQTSGHMGFIEQRQECLREIFRIIYEC